MIVKEKRGGQFFDLIKGDCLIENEYIKDGSVDLILTDLPYGNMNGAALDGWKHNKTSWDFAIEPEKIFEIAKRVLRKNGKIILFSQEPYTSQLITRAIPNIPLSYRAIWEKNNFANCLFAKKAMVNFYEDVLVYTKDQCYTSKHPLRNVMITYVEKYGKDYIIELFEKEGRYTSEASARVSASYKFAFNKGMRFDLMDYDLYNFLSKYIEFEHDYQWLQSIDIEYKYKFASTFNLWEGKKYKSNILKYKKDYDGHHPTQKPVLLLEDLIKTFSNENDLVVDLTMGSGSTGVACVNTKRNFIGVEKDDKYFDIAVSRIKGAEPNQNNFEKVEERGLFSFTDDTQKS